MSKTKAKSTFEVDKAGLSKILERRGKHFALLELTQNALDEDGVTEVHISLEKWDDPARPDMHKMTVIDDSPEGFADMTHAYTLFAESKKKDRADQRGRFNLGEKLVIAICETVVIRTTKGSIEFDDEGRHELPEHTMRGSIFTGWINMTATEAKAAEAAIQTVIIPEGIKADFNGTPLLPRTPIKQFQVTLRTELADAEGYLRPTRRKTTVSVYEPREGEVATLYEMGIPVVDTEDRWHVDIAQKVPLNTDRDNVPPGWLRDVRVAVLNECADLLKPEEAQAKWVDDALEDEDAKPEAIKAVVKGRYGDKAVIEDRTDPEGTKMAMAQGYTVIPGGAFSKKAWQGVKGSSAVLPAGQVTPSPNPNIGDEELQLMTEEHWPEGVKRIAALSVHLGAALLGAEIKVRVTSDIKWKYLATYGPTHRGKGGLLTLGYGRLGHAWFNNGASEPVLALIIHEFAHHKVSDHLSSRFYDECCRIGARLAAAVAEDPSILEIADREVAA